MRKVVFTVFFASLIIANLCGAVQASSNGSRGCSCSSCHKSEPDQCVTNSPPVANAGPDQTVLGGRVVTLNGSNSTDPDGIIASYAWKVTAGPAVALSNAAAEKPTFTAPTAGTSGTSLTFQLTVTDIEGLTATDTCIVNVSPTAPTNQPPVANAGPDQTVNEGVAVTLNGSNSTDPERSTLSYLWTQTAGPSVTLSGSTAAQPTFRTPNVGTTGASLTFQLIVTDNGGLQATDTCVVNVSWVNAPPTANAGPDQTVNERVTVTLNGSGTSDPDNGIASYQWTQTLGPAVTLSNAAVARPTFTAPAGGTSGVALTFQLTVTDNGGLTATDTCLVNVTAAVPTNQPPVASAGVDQIADSGATVTLDASGSADPDGRIASYQWQQTAGTPVTLSSATDTTPTFKAPTAVATAGTSRTSLAASLTFQLTVTDNGGLQSTDTCIVSIAPAGDSSGNLPPEADAGQDQSVRSGARVTLDGSNSSDPNDDNISYVWKQVSGRPVTLSNSRADKPTFQAPSGNRSGGSLRFRLTVTDESGLKSSDTCVVYVTGANRRSSHHENEAD